MGRTAIMDVKGTEIGQETSRMLDEILREKEIKIDKD